MSTQALAVSRRALLLAAVSFCAACSSNGSTTAGGGSGMLDPPQVFLTSNDTVVIAPTLKLRAQVSGCTKVVGIEILQGKRRLITFDNPKVPFEFELQPSLFDPLYQTAGIAANLNLVARGVCDDGREGKSLGLTLQFFPVENVVPPVTGNTTALPDAFIAEGGTGGTPTTFIGCVGIGSGKTTIARFDTMGKAVSVNLTPPFNCSYNSLISEKNPGTGTRWLLEPLIGLYSFDSNPTADLNIKRSFTGKAVKFLGVGPDGDALTYDSQALPIPLLYRVSRLPGGISYQTEMNGIMIGNPVVSQGEIRIVTWVGSLAVFTGEIHVSRYNYASGLKLSEVTLATIEFGEFNTPKPPVAIFSADGKVVYFSFQTVTTGMRTTSGVAACASDSAVGCLSGGAGSWLSPTLDTVVAAAIPFSNGTMIAAVGATKTYFLSATDGKIINVFNAAIKPSGSMETFTAQQGNLTDFYILNGAANASYPTEIVAVDNPTTGELWRLTLGGGGQSPLNALNVAVDDGNNAWLRVGPNLVKPSTLSQYRSRKGANLPPDGGE